MRTSTLSRSVMAVASLAIGSAVFAAVPATAATATGITRTEVLAAASGLRADLATSDELSEKTQAAVNALVAKVCGPDARYRTTQPVEVPDGVDGLAVTSFVTPSGTQFRVSTNEVCSFTALAPIAGGTTFSGEARVETDSSFFFGEDSRIRIDESSSTDNTYPLADDVFVSPAQRSTSPSYAIPYTSVDAEGLVRSPGSQRVLTSVKVTDTKTKADKRVAKKAYVKRLKAVKKSYTKALRKAGKSAQKKATARTKYLSRRTSAKNAYAYAIADYKFVNRRTTQAAERRFDATANSILSGARF